MTSPDDSVQRESPTAERRERPTMLVGGLVVRRVRVPPREVVFLKGVLEASEGVAAVFAESGGDLTIATLPGQENELDRILQDLREETGALFVV